MSSTFPGLLTRYQSNTKTVRHYSVYSSRNEHLYCRYWSQASHHRHRPGHSSLGRVGCRNTGHRKIFTIGNPSNTLARRSHRWCSRSHSTVPRSLSVYFQTYPEQDSAAHLRRPNIHRRGRYIASHLHTRTLQ